MLASAMMAAAATPDTPQAFAVDAGATADMADIADIANMKAQLGVGEYADVATDAERIVARLEEDRGRYHVSLAEPLMLLGDARMGLGDAEAALRAYDRAKHITRIGAGVQGLAQLDLLYREVDALTALKDYQAANDRHEFAYSLMLRQHGADNPALLPSLYKLAEWYRHHYKFRASQVLYEQIIDIAKSHYAATDPRLIDTLRAYAGTFREKRYGARELGRGGFRAWPPGHPKDPPWRTHSTFLRGRKVLREVLSLCEQSPAMSNAEVAAAVVELADWNLLHYYYGIAMRHYRRAWALLESDAEALAETFERPTPLFLRLPPDPAARSPGPGTPHDGIVRLALNVTHRGDVIGRRTLLAEPRNLMEFKLRRAAKQARYRPAFAAGDPVPRRGLKVEFKYRYYPGDLALSR